MSEDAARRRSGRRRATNPRYVDNVTDFDLGSSDSEEELVIPNNDDSDDVDFDEAAALEQDDEGEVIDESEDGTTGIAAVREGNDNDIDNVLEEPKARTTRPVKRVMKPPSLSSSGARRPIKPKVSRGLRKINKEASRRDRIEHTFGTADEDLLLYLRNRDTWQDDFTLPSHVAPSFYHSEVMRQRESTEGWKWYTADSGKEAFTKHQSMKHLPQTEAQQYLPDAGVLDQRCVLGPPKKQKMVTLESGTSVRLGDGWSSKIDRSGYVINIGAKTQSIDWLPNNDASEQYLAVATLQKEPCSKSRLSEEFLSSPVPPGFTAASLYPASIQIWRVSKEQAVLNTVLCFDWCDAEQIKWCPMPGPVDEKHACGLLACIFFDGSIRILDLDLHRSSPPQYTHVVSTAFTCVLPQSVLPTCLTWLSTQSLAVACSNGHVAIFSLPSHLNSTCDPTSKPRPWFYQSIHSTYILSITSAYPSRPHLLITSSYDGTIRLTDLRSPTSDTVTSPRSRIGTAAVTWSDRLQSAISVDELGVMKANTIRRFFSQAETGKVGAIAGNIASSPLHASLLVGGLDGRCFVSNPIRRIANMKKAEVWRQCWFEYSWRRPLSDAQVEVVRQDRAAKRAQDAGAAGPEAMQTDDDDDLAHLKQPLSRFLDGYRPEQVMGPGVDTNKYTLTYHTMYEEQSGIMQVAWNPNVSFGGWAAAGTGSGLIRIEDLTLKKEEVTAKRTKPGPGRRV